MREGGGGCEAPPRASTGGRHNLVRDGQTPKHKDRLKGPPDCENKNTDDKKSRGQGPIPEMRMFRNMHS